MDIYVSFNKKDQRLLGNKTPKIHIQKIKISKQTAWYFQLHENQVIDSSKAVAIIKYEKEL